MIIALLVLSGLLVVVAVGALTCHRCRLPHTAPAGSRLHCTRCGATRVLRPDGTWARVAP